MLRSEPGATAVEARAFSYESGAVGQASSRPIAVEAPVQFVIGGAPFAVMMATPADLEDFAYGFLFTEGVATRHQDVRSVQVANADAGWRVDVALAGDTLKTHLARKRAIAGRTGCGLCGVEDLEHLPQPQRRGARPARPIEPAAIGAALSALDARQPLNALTHAVHAAAWCDRDGRIALVREDVGRHNALDKAIGALWRAGADPDGGFFMVTSRCSFEMVAKTAMFGARTLVAVSAPTSLALDKAKEYGIAIVAVARADKALTFAGERVDGAGGLAA